MHILPLALSGFRPTDYLPFFEFSIALFDKLAAVAGLAGLALERQNLAGLAFAGVEPYVIDGIWREGYILCPTRAAAE